MMKVLRFISLLFATVFMLQSIVISSHAIEEPHHTDECMEEHLFETSDDVVFNEHAILLENDELTDGLYEYKLSGIEIIYSEDEVLAAKAAIPDYTGDYLQEMNPDVLSDVEHDEFVADLLAGLVSPLKQMYTIEDVRQYLYFKYSYGKWQPYAQPDHHRYQELRNRLHQ